MDVFVYREPKGFETRDLEDIGELAGQLGQYGLLTPDSEVKVEITAPWREIKGLLELPQMEAIWFNPETDPRFREKG